MDIRIVISADPSAQEFARNLGKIFSAYVSESDIEAGIVGKFLNGIGATIEPDTMPWEDEVEKGRAYYEQAKKSAEKIAVPAGSAIQIDAKEMRAKAIAFGKAHGNDAMKLILAKIGVAKLSDLSADQRVLASEMIDEAMKGQ